MAVQLEEYATYAELAKEHHCSKGCVQSWVYRGGIKILPDPRCKKGGKLVLRADVEEYLATHRQRRRHIAVDPTTQDAEPPRSLSLRERLATLRPECHGCRYREEFECSKFGEPNRARVADDGDCVYYGVRPGDLPRPAARDWRVCRHDGEVRDGRCMRCGRKVEGVEE